MRTWTVSSKESAPTSGRGDSPRVLCQEKKGNKIEPTVPNRRFFVAFVSQWGACGEDYISSVEKNRIFLLKTSVDQVGYNKVSVVIEF